MPDVQYFKGDDTEKKFDLAGKDQLDAIELQRNSFFDGAYTCFLLGELLYDSGRAPLANAIAREIFREAFATIFDAFVVAGSFESYLTVFRNIFGEDVDVTFTVPAPGKLQISIEATGVELNNFDVRRIVDNAYVLDDLVDYVGDTIVLQTIKGFTSQYELEQMLFEMVPAGVFTQITLTLGA